MKTKEQQEFSGAMAFGCFFLILILIIGCKLVSIYLPSLLK